MKNEAHQIWMPLLLAAGCVLAGGMHAHAGTLSLWPEAVINSDQLTLGDVCRIEGFAAGEAARLADISVAPAPAPGSTLVLGIDELREPLAQAGVNLATVVIKGAAHCNVRRPRQAAPADKPKPATTRSAGASAPLTGTSTRLGDAVEKFFADQLGRTDGRVEVQFGRVDATVLDLSSPEFEFRIRQTSGRSLGLTGISVDIVSPAGVMQTLNMVAQVSFVKPIVIATRPINLGATVSAADVRLAESIFTHLDDVGIGDLSSVMGQRARRFIPVGKALQPRDLEPLPLVRRGQFVEVVSKSGGVSIISSAKALGEGVYGDYVDLRVGENRAGKSFSGVVIGPGRVEVGALPGDRSLVRSD